MTNHEQWHLTRDAAELYERYVARYILGPWAPVLLDAARLVPGERVLDVACGTGVVTRAAAERVSGSGSLEKGLVLVDPPMQLQLGWS